MIDKLQRDNEVGCRLCPRRLLPSSGCASRGRPVPHAQRHPVINNQPQSIKAELDLETRYAQRRTVSNSTLNRLNDQVDMYTSKVEIERKNEKQLRSAVKQMTKKILSKVRGVRRTATPMVAGARV